MSRTVMTRHLTGARAGTAALAALLSMTLAACSGSAGSDVERESEAVTAAEGAGFTVSAALADLPEDRAWQTVGVVDLSAAAEATGVELSKEDLTWRSALFAGFPLEDLADTPREDLTYAPVFATAPQLLDRAIQSDVSGQLPESVGWSPLAVTSYAYQTGGSIGTTEFVVVDGPFPDDALVGLTDLGDGVWTLGEGEDGQMLTEGEGMAIDTLGRPVRMAQHDQQIAFSTVTAPVRAWADGGGSTAADLPELAEPATVLDGAGAITAFFALPRPYDPIGLTVGPGSSPEEIEEFHETWEEQLVSAPFSSIAIGHDGEGTATIVYRFVAAEGAEEAAPQIESLLAGDTFDGSRSLSEAIVVESVEVQDNLVVVTGTRPQAVGWSVLHQMVVVGEPPFVLR